MAELDPTPLKKHGKKKVEAEVQPADSFYFILFCFIFDETNLFLIS
jgi:hypothetical protein